MTTILSGVRRQGLRFLVRSPRPETAESKSGGNASALHMALVGVSWLVAAALVGATHVFIEPLSASGSTVLTIAILLGTSYAYTRVRGRDGGSTHGLGVGIAWLSLSIAVEIIVSTWLGHGWFTLLGSPAHPVARQIVLFTWIFAPAVFSRRTPEE